ncbi:MAG TPA: amidohydrolase [Streptosporangiaceae bacterium]|nr:amidohydrolase [Streptosporangiaceae bacterium]
MSRQDADLVLRGGAVYAVDAARSWAQAVAVRDGAIIAVGTNAQIGGLTGAGTQVIDLAGRMLLPGFVDAHVHASAAGLERLRCDLSEAHGLDDYLTVVRRYAQASPGAEWITGGGWSIGVFPGGAPSRRDLDRVAPDRPVFLSNRDHHGAWVNSRALELAGVTAGTPDPADGRIEREPDGTPSGTLQEGAMGLVERVIPRPGVEEQVAGITEAQRYLHALGITGWQEAIVGDYAVVPDCFDAYLEADRRGLLTARVVGALWWQRGLGAGQLDGLTERRERAGSAGRFRATSVKIMQDGVCENFTASMLTPYLDGHGHETTSCGSSFFGADELKESVTVLDARGFQVHFHAIGDKAVREALDAVAAARAANGAGDGRHHISHIQVVHPHDLPRFRELGVLANCQPLWACEEPQMTELTLPFLGPERSSWQYPFGSLLRSGAQLCFGSDWPVSSPNPLWELHTAVNRTVAPGYPYAGPGAGNVFLPGERISLHDAVAAFTIVSAYVNHADDVSGSIEAGKSADLVVLDRNLFAHPVEEVALANIDMTFSSGQMVHERAA